MSADDFAHAVQFVWQLPPENDGNGVKVSNETKLKLYGLYKQATEVRECFNFNTWLMAYRTVLV